MRVICALPKPATVVYSEMVTANRTHSASALDLRDIFERGGTLPSSDRGARDYLFLVALLPLDEALEV